MQFCVSLPAVLFWGQPWEEKASKKKNKPGFEFELSKSREKGICLVNASKER